MNNVKTILAEGYTEKDLEEIIENIDEYDEYMEGFDEENEYLTLTITRNPK